ncbi:MAG: hypothetical protein QW594_03740 [Candidatus Woesearchaeota archaeon]
MPTARLKKMEHVVLFALTDKNLPAVQEQQAALVSLLARRDEGLEDKVNTYVLPDLSQYTNDFGIPYYPGFSQVGSLLYTFPLGDLELLFFPTSSTALSQDSANQEKLLPPASPVSNNPQRYFVLATLKTFYHTQLTKVTDALLELLSPHSWQGTYLYKQAVVVRNYDPADAFAAYRCSEQEKKSTTFLTHPSGRKIASNQKYQAVVFGPGIPAPGVQESYFFIEYSYAARAVSLNTNSFLTFSKDLKKEMIAKALLRQQVERFAMPKETFPAHLPMPEAKPQWYHARYADKQQVDEYIRMSYYQHLHDGIVLYTLSVVSKTTPSSLIHENTLRQMIRSSFRLAKEESHLLYASITPTHVLPTLVYEKPHHVRHAKSSFSS